MYCLLLLKKTSGRGDAADYIRQVKRQIYFFIPFISLLFSDFTDIVQKVSFLSMTYFIKKKEKWMGQLTSISDRNPRSTISGMTDDYMLC